MGAPTVAERDDLLDAAETFLNAAEAYADRNLELRRTDGFRDGPGSRRDRAIARYMSAEEHFQGRAEALRAAIAKARGEPSDDQDSGDAATLSAALDRELAGPVVDHEARLFGEER